MDSGVSSHIDDDTHFCVTSNFTSSFVPSFFIRLFFRFLFRELDGLLLLYLSRLARNQ